VFSIVCLWFLPVAIMADVHYMRESVMRLVARLSICFMPILANAAQTDAQAPSDPQAYCVNHSADFYPYTGEPCKSGYQLSSPLDPLVAADNQETTSVKSDSHVFVRFPTCP